MEPDEIFENNEDFKVVINIKIDQMNIEVKSQQFSKELGEVLQYIINSLEKQHFTQDFIIFGRTKLNEEANVSIQQIIDKQITQLFIDIPSKQLKTSRENNKEPEVQAHYEFDLESEQVLMTKFRHQKEFEKSQIFLHSIRQLNSKFKDTFERVLSQKQQITHMPMLSKDEIQEMQTQGKVPEGSPLQQKLASSVQSSQFQFQYNSQHQITSGKKNELKKYTLEEIAQHKSINDVWTVVNGQVYDITNYIKVHPGGIDKILLGAGTDCTLLFNQNHPYINVHFLLANNHIGSLCGKKQNTDQNSQNQKTS